jgi:hypothetical protein
VGSTEGSNVLFLDNEALDSISSTSRMKLSFMDWI